jgi:hypothetical protein
VKQYDPKKDPLYKPSKKEFSLVDVPPMNFLMVDGHGNPNTVPEYPQAIEALYAMAYTIKFTLKPSGIDYGVPPLESLWWMEGTPGFNPAAKDNWDWTAMIMQPEWVTTSLVEQTRGEVMKKKDPPALPRLRFESYHEGLSVQILYIGPYADEGPTIARMHDHIADLGYHLHGKHHEIYLGDPRRSAPEKLRTIIRQPIFKPDPTGS